MFHHRLPLNPVAGLSALALAGALLGGCVVRTQPTRTRTVVVHERPPPTETVIIHDRRPPPRRW